ncbi:MAG: T9SS type A sorting domain-containing protein, partial [Flavisolibacter sp.]
DIYQIHRSVRLVDRFSCPYGDFALCEILGPPIPPHFNPYFAGWNPNELMIGLTGPFGVIHHPGGNIKKISAAPVMLRSSGAVKTTCVTVTKVVDFLFGWIWKRKWSTQVVCTYLQLPLGGTKYEIANFNYGKIEDGSSGAGLFSGFGSSSSRLIGDVSASLPEYSCSSSNLGISYFGKFSDSYYRQSVKNTLNPGNKNEYDVRGLDGRQISCYQKIDLNADAEQAKFVLYPANLYQQQNAITLTSQSTFVTTGSITVKNGADFTFKAGESIDLNYGFETEPGASFVAEATPSPCVIEENARKATNEMYDVPELNKALQNIPVPQQKKFDITKYVPEVASQQSSNVTKFNLYPNPSKGNINVELFFKGQEKNALVDLYDLYGHHVYSKKYSNIFFIKESLNLSLKNGMYNMIIRTDRETFTKKVVVAQ